MKKTEAISILATSVRPREPKDRARYDEAVKMAIEALKSSEIPNNSERTAETSQIDHNADIGKKAEGDCISRRAAIDALDEQIEQCNKALGSFDISPKDEYAIKVERASLEAYKEQLENMPSEQPTVELAAERETTTVTIGKTRGGRTEWYECDNCGEPVHPEDRYCSRCGRRLKVPSGDMHENLINREK